VLDIDGTLIDSCTEEEARARGITAFVETVDDDGDCGIKRPFVWLACPAPGYLSVFLLLM
jgi:hypothetical protein